MEDERRLRRHLPDRNPKFPFLVEDTQTRIHETEAEREDDSFMLPTVNDAKMIIMPEIPAMMPKSIAISTLRQLANTISA